MDGLSLILTALLCMLLLYALMSRGRSEYNSLKLIPGPTRYPIIGTVLPLLWTKRSDFFLYLRKQVKENGSFFINWIGPKPDIHIMRPEHLEIVLGSSKHLDKAYGYNFLHSWLGTGLLTSTGQKWHTHRKMITPTFHFKILDSFIDVFTEKSEIMMNKLQKEVGNKGFDVYPYITKCALDIICETAMGTQIFAQDDGNSEYVRAVYDMSEIIMNRLFRPWLHPDFMFKLSSIGKRHDECLRVLHGFTNQGHDTTSAGMSWTIYLLGLHPDVQEKAFQEQEAIFQGSQRSATMKDLNEMKYLERVIKESLRLYPSVPTIGRMTTEECKLGEYTIPKNCALTLKFYFLHRLPEFFPDPEKFDPDRFLPEVVAKRHPYAYLPFSAGPRNCIGQKFALLEEKTILSSFLRNYKVTSLEKREDIKLLSEMVLRPINGIKVTIESRNSKPRLSYKIWYSQLFNYFHTIVKEHAPIFLTWVGPKPDVHVMRPEYLEIILNSSKHLDKSYAYDFVHSWLGTGLLTSTGLKWHTHRKLITPTFHFKILDSFVDVFSEKSEIMISKLQKEVGNKGFDVYPYITKCALDIICETAMGTQIFAQDDGNSEYVKAIYDMSEIVIKRILRPWLHPDIFFKYSALGKRHDECLRVLHGFTSQVIRERKSQMLVEKEMSKGISGSEDEYMGKKKRKAFLDLLLEASVGSVKLTDEELREEVDTFMFEGHDTTSAGMSWVIYLLGLYPEVQEKAFQEQEAIFQGSQRSATMKDLNEMKYLERVIKESLRLYPSVPTIGRMTTEECKLGKYTIPKNCALSLQFYFLHRLPEFFPDPEKFDPDRFLPEVVAKRHPYAYLPFSAGPRNCIGQKFAVLEEKTVLSSFIRNYKVTSLEKREDLKLLSELVLRPANGIQITIESRNKKSN
ncbi:hypothetical protein C0J52_03127 [Blattella germanica]|nr:hypothetical protein C0J52_03127 [Blattella germanica]